MNGVLILNKPSGWTSHDVVARVRSILKEPSVGHLGTLDPLATGVLPLVLGAATRLVQFTDYDKEYEARCLLGRTTDTEDVTGRTLEEKAVGGLEPEIVRQAFRGLMDVREQVPPMMSAVKQGGVKLYELARQGKTVERKPRPVTIRNVEVLDLDLPRVSFRVTCSGGTYVRTLCRTAGETLGCGGCLETLVRTRVGPFTLDGAATLEVIEKDPGAAPIRGANILVSHFPEILLDAAHLSKLCAGSEVVMDLPASGWVRIANPEGRLVAMAEFRNGVLQPRKVFGMEGV